MRYSIVISTLIAALLAIPPPPSSGYGGNKGLDIAALVKVDAKVGHLVSVDGKVIAKVDLLTGKTHYYRRGLVDANVKLDVGSNKGNNYATNKGLKVDVDADVKIGGTHNGAYY